MDPASSASPTAASAPAATRLCDASRTRPATSVATGAAAALNPALLVVLLVCFAAGALSHAIAVGVLAGFGLLPIAAAWVGGRGLALTCCALLAAVLLRRLEGLSRDIHGAGSEERRIVLRRLFLDERPGQALVGPRDSSAAVKPRP